MSLVTPSATKVFLENVDIFKRLSHDLLGWSENKRSPLVGFVSSPTQWQSQYLVHYSSLSIFDPHILMMQSLTQAQWDLLFQMGCVSFGLSPAEAEVRMETELGAFWPQGQGKATDTSGWVRMSSQPRVCLSRLTSSQGS